MSDAPLLTLEHATKTFELKSLFGPSKRVEALRDVSLTLTSGAIREPIAENDVRPDVRTGPPGLEQDRGDQRDADDDLADGQERVHVRIDLRWERLRMISALVRRYQQRCAGHARPARQAGQLAHRRRHVGEHTVPE